MAKILADHEIIKLLNTVLLDASKDLVNPNGIELRLGKDVRFHSTGTEKILEDGMFLRVEPGETVIITSLETIDFSREAVKQIFPDSMLMGLITPTTTMMREGISQVATKIDAGFMGNLNWSLRNGSTNSLILQFSEPIFKLTIFLLEKDEIPELPYGERFTDSYQNSSGVMRSQRKIPADIPKSKIISSGWDKLDHKKRLREAGYPFDHIGTELVELHGKFETVSKEVLLLKDQIQERTDALSNKISDETKAISSRIEDIRTTLIERVEILFDKKFLRILCWLIASISILFGGVKFLQEQNVGDNTVALIATIFGCLVLLLTFFIGKRN